MEDINFYMVSHAWYEEEHQYYFFGPKVENWEKLCESLVEKATKQAMKRELEEEKEWPDRMGALKVYSIMIEMLEEKGFTYIDRESIPAFQIWGCTSMCFWDSMGVDDKGKEKEGLEAKLSEDMIKKVKAYNKLTQKICEETSKKYEELEDG